MDENLLMKESEPKSSLWWAMPCLIDTTRTAFGGVLVFNASDSDTPNPDFRPSSKSSCLDRRSSRSATLPKIVTTTNTMNMCSSVFSEGGTLLLLLSICCYI